MENREKYLEQKIEEIQRKQSRDIQNSNKKRKGFILSGIALVLAGATFISGCVFSKKKSGNKDNNPTQSTVDTTPTITPEDQISINGLGLVYEDPTLETEKQEYGKTTGDVKKEDLVEKNDTVWKDKEAANNSSNVGKTEIDDKKGTLEVKPNGDVVVKNEGYEIEKEDGKVETGTITEEDKEKGEIGSNGTILPPGYVHDENLDKDVVEEDKDKFVYCDADYYDSTGALVYAKGELIKPKDLELAKKLLSTTKPVVETKKEENKNKETKKEETFVPTQGTINPDGTYTIDGITFETKADYEQWVIQGFEGYGMDLDGIMKPEEEIIANYNQKTK